MRPLVVVGDAMLDVDIEGTSERLCPEAPVPVVDIAREWHRPGGAALAAMLAARTAGGVALVAPLGEDHAGHTVTDLLSGLVRVHPLPMRGRTPRKTRIRAGGQSMLRLDDGSGVAGHGDVPGRVARLLRGAGCVVVADYGRGTTAHPGIRALLAEIVPRTPVVWDPHPRGTRPVPGVRLVTPNLAEATAALPGSGKEPARLARELVTTWEASAAAVTTGADGAVLAERDGSGEPAELTVPLAERATASASQRPDTCGAGDRFATAAAATLAGGGSVRDAVHDAVRTAARFVATGGAASVSAPSEEPPIPQAGATTPRAGTAHALALAARVRARGGRVIATGGCFDLLHAGHTALLRRARSFGDALVVCLNSDASVRARKGPDRPIVPAHDRARLLTELSCVDAVAIFDEPDPRALLRDLRPDVWVKGGDYAEEDLPESPVVRVGGGHVRIVPLVGGYSTSKLVSAAQLSRVSNPADR